MASRRALDSWRDFATRSSYQCSKWAKVTKSLAFTGALGSAIRDEIMRGKSSTTCAIGTAGQGATLRQMDSPLAYTTRITDPRSRHFDQRNRIGRRGSRSSVTERSEECRRMAASVMGVETIIPIDLGGCQIGPCRQPAAGGTALTPG
ncbi:hypothetical protein D3C78_1468210 [compost metagenome]